MQLAAVTNDSTRSKCRQHQLSGHRRDRFGALGCKGQAAVDPGRIADRSGRTTAATGSRNRLCVLPFAGYLAFLFCVPMPALAEVVAEVFGHPIYASELEPPAALSERIKSGAAVDYAAWTAGYKRGKFAGLLMSRVREERIRKDGFLPTEEEIQAFLRFESAPREGEPQAVGEQTAPPARPAQEVQEQGGTQGAGSDAAAQGTGEAPQGAHQDTPQSETPEQMRDQAAAQIANWKLKRSLYLQHGGRVVIQESSYEPVDAIKQCLEGLASSGDIEIKDPTYAGVFDDLDRYLTTRRKFATEEAAERYFAAPWWEAEPLPPAE